MVSKVPDDLSKIWMTLLHQFQRVCPGLLPSLLSVGSGLHCVPPCLPMLPCSVIGIFRIRQRYSRTPSSCVAANCSVRSGLNARLEKFAWAAAQKNNRSISTVQLLHIVLRRNPSGTHHCGFLRSCASHIVAFVEIKSYASIPLTGTIVACGSASVNNSRMQAIVSQIVFVFSAC